MVRGRHRGLPIAIDRAVLLPVDTQLPSSEDENPVQEAHQTP